MTNRLRSLVVFVVLVTTAGLLIGGLNKPGAWYAALNKPSFNPPGWIFSPVWTVLYIFIALAGWRTWLQETPIGLAMQLWFTQMALNFIWSPVVFTLHSLVGGLAIILAMLASIVGFIWVQAPANKAAALFFLPYAAWVSFAAILNYSLYRLN